MATTKTKSTARRGTKTTKGPRKAPTTITKTPVAPSKLGFKVGEMVRVVRANRYDVPKGTKVKVTGAYTTGLNTYVEVEFSDKTVGSMFTNRVVKEKDFDAKTKGVRAA